MYVCALVFASALAGENSCKARRGAVFYLSLCLKNKSEQNDGVRESDLAAGEIRDL